MKTSVLLLITSVAAAFASPLALQPQEKCNVAPSAPVDPRIQPFKTSVKAATAQECQKVCESDSSCLSFAFGLTAGANTPTCLLFKVAAAKVPVRTDGLHVFDKACPLKLVPSSAPTHRQPWGTVHKMLAVRGQQQCNCAPTGPANSKIKPFKTVVEAATAQECQKVCESDAVCLSFLFGLLDGSTVPICELFKVPAAHVPAEGKKLFVFDKTCPAKAVPVTAPTHENPCGLVAGAAQKQGTASTNAAKPSASGHVVNKAATAKPESTQAPKSGENKSDPKGQKPSAVKPASAVAASAVAEDCDDEQHH